jgi:2-keto-4-pentenoate hydratase/2-oxohepta-3-ene-1,7-dioic acid hydratase in catechol pathway
MRLVSYAQDGDIRLGFVAEDMIVDPLLATPNNAAERRFFTDAVAFIRAGEQGRHAAEQIISVAPASARLPFGATELLAPIRPSTILCSGSNYRDHNAEKVNTPISGKEPEFFIKTADSVIGPNEAILYDPILSKKIDCETELAIVIGKPGRHIPTESALDHVFGYTIVNDVTARDRQVRKSPEGTVWYELGRSKSFETSAPLGPMIVTADEIPNPQNLGLQTRINGELRQSSNTSNMIWSCVELIHFFSVNFVLRPGMVIITGTPSGTAWSTDRELGGKWQGQKGLVAATRYCLPGDAIESEVEKIGVLRNVVRHVDR